MPTAICKFIYWNIYSEMSGIYDLISSRSCREKNKRTSEQAAALACLSALNLLPPANNCDTSAQGEK